MNVPAWPCTTTSSRSWLGRPSSYRANNQQPLISSFDNGSYSKSATIAMIDSAGAATSTALFSRVIGRAYRFQQRPDRPRDGTRSPGLPVDVHMDPMALRCGLFTFTEDGQPIGNAAVAHPRPRQPDRQR